MDKLCIKCVYKFIFNVPIIGANIAKLLAVILNDTAKANAKDI